MFSQEDPKEEVMKNLIQRFVREEEGQDLVEYAFLLAFVALVAVVGVKVMGSGISGLFTSINGQLASGT
jgi:pilus assembly protein Flp/PilA